MHLMQMTWRFLRRRYLPQINNFRQRFMLAFGEMTDVNEHPKRAHREALAAILIAGVFASSPTEVATNGCEVIPWNAQIELLERYPSGLHFLRVIKVKMTSPARSDSTVGFTIETGR